jgi:hypothetical protein
MIKNGTEFFLIKDQNLAMTLSHMSADKIAGGSIELTIV